MAALQQAFPHAGYTWVAPPAVHSDSDTLRLLTQGLVLVAEGMQLGQGGNLVDIGSLAGNIGGQLCTLGAGVTVLPMRPFTLSLLGPPTYARVACLHPLWHLAQAPPRLTRQRLQNLIHILTADSAFLIYSLTPDHPHYHRFVVAIPFFPIMPCFTFDLNEPPPLRPLPTSPILSDARIQYLRQDTAERVLRWITGPTGHPLLIPPSVSTNFIEAYNDIMPHNLQIRPTKDVFILLVNPPRVGGAGNPRPLPPNSSGQPNRNIAATGNTGITAGRAVHIHPPQLHPPAQGRHSRSLSPPNSHTHSPSPRHALLRNQIRETNSLGIFQQPPLPLPQMGRSAQPQAQLGFSAQPQAQPGRSVQPQPQPGHSAQPQLQPGHPAQLQAQENRWEERQLRNRVEGRGR